jgi:hypothetical protein
VFSQSSFSLSYFIFVRKGNRSPDKLKSCITIKKDLILSSLFPALFSFYGLESRLSALLPCPGKKKRWRGLDKTLGLDYPNQHIQIN